jgi:cobalt-zinc-cadmium efflux system outer membrane protein
MVQIIRTRMAIPWFAWVVLGVAAIGSATESAAADETAEAPPPELPENPSLADYLRVAQRRSPDLEASYRHWQAAREEIARTGSFPDPRLSFAWFAEEVETRVGPQKQRLSLRQRLPWFGTLNQREEVAEARAAAAKGRHDARRLELRRDVTVAWYDLYELGRALALTQENVALLEDLEHSVDAKYRTSLATHADLVRIQMERDLLEDRVHSLEDRVRAVSARMNALLHRPADAPIPLPQTLPLLTASPNAERVRAAVREFSPTLRVREGEVSSAAAAERLARRERWPDWTFGIDWIRTGESQGPAPPPDSGKDALALSLAVEVPLFRGKHDGAVRETEERLVAAQAARDADLDRLIAAAEDVLSRWRDAERREELYRTSLLPRAREALNVTRTGYETGGSGFLDLIESQRLLLEFELARARALADCGRSAAELEQGTGRSWAEEVSR